mgnify:FL=1
MSITGESVLTRLQSMLQQFCTLCYNGKAVMNVSAAPASDG